MKKVTDKRRNEDGRKIIRGKRKETRGKRGKRGKKEEREKE